MILASANGAVMTVVILLILLAAFVYKLSTYRSTKCIHCGHDSGIKGADAPICPACGRNRTVLRHRKARRR